MVKKISLVIIAVLLCTGCANAASQRDVSANYSWETVEPITTEKEADSQNTDESIVINGEEYLIYGRIDSEAAMSRMYYNIDDLGDSEAAEVIVKGTVCNIEYEYLEHCAFTKYTLNVEKCYKGSVPEQICIYEDGGYIPMSELSADISDHIDVEDAEISNYVMDMTFMGAEHVEEGDTIIAYLHSTSEPMESGSYQYVSSVFGRFILKGQTYVRTDLELRDEDSNVMTIDEADAFETSIAKDNLEHSLEEKF